MRILLFSVLSIFSSQLLADNVDNYRSAFLKQCQNDSDSAEDDKICECIYREWRKDVANPQDPGAITAVKIASQIPGNYSGAQLAPANAYLASFANNSQNCFSFTIPERSASNEAEPENSAYGNPMPGFGGYGNQPSGNQPSAESAGGSTGLLGAMVGWAGNKLGVPTEINQAAREQVDKHEPSLTERLGSFAGGFNPFGSGSSEKSATASGSGTPLGRPMNDYQDDFMRYCGQANSGAVCACRWQSLQHTVRGKSSGVAGTVAFMASNDPGDIPDQPGVSRDEVFKTFMRYNETSSSCR